MLRLRSGLVLILALAAMTVLGAVAPAWAHTGSTLRLIEAPPGEVVVDAAVASTPLPLELSAAPAPPGIPWPVLLGAFVLAAAAWRRPRRALVLAVVLLLAVFAFEDGLHSVHHLLDTTKLAKCQVAVAAAHLNATAVDDAGVTDVILPAPAVATDAGQSAPATRFPSPVQGRAPPTRAA